MPESPTRLLMQNQVAGIEHLKQNWGWFLGLGIALIILGTISLGCAFTMTVASVFVFGCLMIVAGALETIQAFRSKAWGGFFLELLTGILYLVVGFLMRASMGAGGR